MNRRHTGMQAVEAVRRAQAAGFANLTIDLIFGVPGFGGEVLRRNLDRALALGVQHISAYHLTIEKNTAFGRRLERGQFSEVDEQVSEREYLEVHRTLTEAGFEHYEVSRCPVAGPVTMPPTGRATSIWASGLQPTPSTGSRAAGPLRRSTATWPVPERRRFTNRSGLRSGIATMSI